MIAASALVFSAAWVEIAVQRPPPSPMPAQRAAVQTGENAAAAGLVLAPAPRRRVVVVRRSRAS